MADQYRELLELNQVRIKVHAQLREDAVREYYETRIHGDRLYQIICGSDDETRSVFRIPKKEPAADLVVEVSPQRAIIAEVKGSSVERALEQLRNTARYVRPRYIMIEPKIFLNRAAPEGRRDFIDGLYAVLRICNSAYPAEWLLLEHQSQEDASGHFVQIGGMNVTVTFGPLIAMPV